ncbi:hypothetical protein [Comamonas thiooxydans]|uniref:hypothetical protein n=1 Tax=Comamonas thiooxydans TaxID=363952 RepID=UPI001187268A|nr:hypothetical protein [Comamonas thiooxydans]
MQAAIISLPSNASFATSALKRARKEAANNVVFSEETYPAGTEFSGCTLWTGTASNQWESSICLIESNGQRTKARLAIQFDDQAAVSKVVLTRSNGQVHFSKGHH